MQPASHWLLMPLILQIMIFMQLHYQPNDILVLSLSVLIQLSIELIRTIRKPSVQPTVLAERWGITPENAQNTTQATMQRRIRTMFHLSLSRWFRTNDNILHLHCLAHLIFSDMLFASTVSRRGNSCVQVYITDFGWARAFPMVSRSEADETLLLLFARDGVPPACICNNAKWWYKVSSTQSSMMLHITWNSWSHELPGKMLQIRGIKKLKNAVSCKLLRSRASKCLWDDCLELEAYIKSNTAHEVYKLNGEVP